MIVACYHFLPLSACMLNFDLAVAVPFPLYNIIWAPNDSKNSSEVSPLLEELGGR